MDNEKEIGVGLTYHTIGEEMVRGRGIESPYIVLHEPSHHSIIDTLALLLSKQPQILLVNDEKDLHTPLEYLAARGFGKQIPIKVEDMILKFPSRPVNSTKPKKKVKRKKRVKQPRKKKR
jgi:hypothetical protein